MQLISRHEARASGLSRYYTGVPCIRGHDVQRRTRDGKCLECRKARKKRAAERKRAAAARNRKTPEEVAAARRARANARERLRHRDLGTRLRRGVFGGGDNSAVRTYVYVLVTGGFCKIGVSENVERRCAALQRANPLPVGVLRKIGPFSRREAVWIERTAHVALAQKRVMGEWFAVSVAEAVSAVELAGVFS